MPWFIIKLTEITQRQFGTILSLFCLININRQFFQLCALVEFMGFACRLKIGFALEKGTKQICSILRDTPHASAYL